MSTLSKLFSAIKNLGSESKAPPTKPENSPFAIEFDSSVVTDAVKADIRKNIEQLETVRPEHVDQVYEAALRAVMVGGDLRTLSIVLVNICGMTKNRAGQISRHLSANANAVITRERQQSLGITEAIWLHSGAPCAVNPKHPTPQEVRRNEAHMEASGKRFNVSEGMFLNGKWTWPGRDNGCKCISRSITGIRERREQ